MQDQVAAGGESHVGSCECARTCSVLRRSIEAMLALWHYQFTVLSHILAYTYKPPKPRMAANVYFSLVRSCS